MTSRPGYPPLTGAASPWQQRPDLRIGDAERERAASQLAEHYAVGRLSQEEHSERLDRIWAARTRAELDPVFIDLPGTRLRDTAPVAAGSVTTRDGAASRTASRAAAGAGDPRAAAGAAGRARSDRRW